MNVETDLDGFVSAIVADADRIAAALEVGPPGSPVAACPDWDLERLVIHTGTVHRWATAAIRSGAAPEGWPADPDPGTDLAAWMRKGAADLADALDDVDPLGPTWHPFPAPKLGWVWARRQVIETMLHRFDAETAVGSASTFRTDLAVVGIHECLEVGYPRSMRREGLEYPSQSLHIHCTDDDLAPGSGEWLLRVDDGAYVLTTEHAKGDAAIRGRAEDVLLVLMERRERSAIDVVGDESAADAWLALPAW